MCFFVDQGMSFIISLLMLHEVAFWFIPAFIILQIYGEKVPPVEQLAEIKPVELVVITPFSIEPTFQDIFARLVPMKVHLAASEHSDRVDALVRRVNADLEEQVCTTVRWLYSSFPIFCPQDAKLQQTLITLNLGEGFVGEKPLEIDTELFHKAALLRDPDSGLDSIQPSLQRHAKSDRSSIYLCATRMFC